MRFRGSIAREVALAVVIAAGVEQASANTYKCETDSGEVVYQDTPCPAGEQSKQVPAYTKGTEQGAQSRADHEESDVLRRAKEYDRKVEDQRNRRDAAWAQEREQANEREMQKQRLCSAAMEDFGRHQADEKWFERPHNQAYARRMQEEAQTRVDKYCD